MRARMQGQLRFRPDNTGTLATVALTEVTGQSQMACLRGWIELVFEGLHCEAMFHPGLSVTYVSGEEAEYVLPPASAASFQVVLYAKEPIASLKLGSAYEPQSFEVRSCRVVRLGWSGILQRSLQFAFTATLVALFWALLGKKLRARNRMQRILSLPTGTNYPAWLAVQESKWAGEIPLLLQAQADAMAPRLGVMMDVRPGTQISRDSLRSLRDQVGPNWEFAQLSTENEISADGADLPTDRCKVIAVGPRASLGQRLQVGLEDLVADWVFVLRNGDQFALGALARIAEAARLHNNADIIYGDHDMIDDRGRRHAPQFKPDWNLPLFYAHDYIGGVAAFRRDRALALGGFQSGPEGLEVEDLLLRMATASEAQVIHIPRILCHRQSAAEGQSSRPSAESRCQMLRAQFAKRHEKAQVELDRFGHARVIWTLPKPEPLVSLIIPTRDRIDLLRPCLESLRRTAYTNLEILIVDNESRRKKTRSYLSGLSGDTRVRVLAHPGPFNFAAINNQAVRVGARHNRWIHKQRCRGNRARMVVGTGLTCRAC